MGDVQTLPSIAHFLLDTGLALLCLQVPGALLLSRILSESWRGMPPFRKCGYALLASTPIVAGIQALGWILPAQGVQAIVRLFALSCVIAALAALRGWRPLTSPKALALEGRKLWRTEYGFQLVALFIFLLAIAWAASPAVVPGPVAAGYGDLASYYRAIDNLSTGHFPLIDFRISEFVGELYFMPKLYPLLTLLGAFFTHVLLNDHQLLLVITTIYGLIGMFFLGGYLYEKFKSPYVDAHMVVFALGLVCLLPYGHPQHLAFGALTLPVMTLTLILMDLVGSPPVGRRTLRFALIGIGAASIMLMRPEGLLLIVQLGALALLYLLVTRLVRRFGGAWVGVAVAAGLALVILLMPYFPVGTSFSFCYLHYFEPTNTFEFHKVAPDKWPRQDSDTYNVNEDHARQSVGLERRRTELNPEIYSQIRAHPGAFLKWISKILVAQVGGFSLVLLVAVTVRLAWNRLGPMVVLAALGPLHVITLAGINSAFNARHLLPLMALVLAMSIRSLTPERGRALLESMSGRGALRLIMILVLTFFGLAMRAAHEMRLEERTFSHALMLEPLRERIDENTVVASTYPPLVSYELDIPSIGAAGLPAIAYAYAKLHEPDVMVLDSNGLNAIDPEGFDEGMDFIECGLAEDLGYKIVFFDKTRRFMILDRRPGAYAEAIEIEPASYKMANEVSDDHVSRDPVESDT